MNFYSKLSEEEIVLLLEEFFDDLRKIKSRVDFFLAPNLFIEFLMKKYDSVLEISIRISEMMNYIKLNFDLGNNYCRFICRCFGVYSKQIVNEINFPKLILLRENLLNNII